MPALESPHQESCRSVDEMSVAQRSYKMPFRGSRYCDDFVQTMGKEVPRKYLDAATSLMIAANPK